MWNCPGVIALGWLLLSLIDDKSTLVQVMAWCRLATSHYLSQCWPRSMPPCGITRPQWVNLHCNIRDSPAVWCLCAFFSQLPQFYVPFNVEKKKCTILCVIWNFNVLKQHIVRLYLWVLASVHNCSSGATCIHLMTLSTLCFWIPCCPLAGARALSQYLKAIFPGIGISIIKIRWLWDHLIFITGILMLVRLHI